MAAEAAPRRSSTPRDPTVTAQLLVPDAAEVSLTPTFCWIRGGPLVDGGTEQATDAVGEGQAERTAHYDPQDGAADVAAAQPGT